MSDLGELYREVILDHGQRPRNFRAIEGATHGAEGYNPLCGDKLTVYIRVEGGFIVDLAFRGAGCAISTASASIMTMSLKGKSIAEAEGIVDSFHKVVSGAADVQGSEELRSLEAFSGVHRFPLRVKCATLAWHTFRAALNGEGGRVSTE